MDFMKVFFVINVLLLEQSVDCLFAFIKKFLVDEINEKIIRSGVYLVDGK